MKARCYPVSRTVYRAARRAALGVAIAIALLALLEIFRIGLLLYRIRPLAGELFWGFSLALAAGGAVWICVRRSRRRTLFAPPLPAPNQATFRDLKRVVEHLIALLKRGSAHPCLTAQQSKQFRQHAYDLEGMLGAHPLLDDLRRSISRTHDEAWVPLIEIFDREALVVAREKMKAVVRDAIEPPFPVIQPLLLVYHEVMMISCIADCYLTRPTLSDYYTVMRDTWRVMVSGEYYRIGQRLFDGIYRNIPPMGPAAEDLGQALSVIWLTWTTAQAAIHRCRNYTPWTVEKAMSHLDQLTIDSLLVTRDTLIRDVLPILKLRLRHSLGPAVTDAAGFTEEIMAGIVKSVDSVIQGLRTQAPELAAEHSRRSLHGLQRPAEPYPREGRRAS